MAHTMKRLGVYLGLVEDDPNFAPSAHGTATTTAATRQTPLRTVSSESTTSSVATMQRREPSVDVRARKDDTVTPQAPADPYSIHTIHPRSYNDARRIGEEYRAGAPVIMNLTDMGDDEAKRIVDFASGLTFAMHGTIEKITHKVFLLSPANVDVRDAPAVQQARDGFYNQS
jgi:cell division inhibitor SepF